MDAPRLSGLRVNAPGKGARLPEVWNSSSDEARPGLMSFWAISIHSIWNFVLRLLEFSLPLSLAFNRLSAYSLE